MRTIDLATASHRLHRRELRAALHDAFNDVSAQAAGQGRAQVQLPGGGDVLGFLAAWPNRDLTAFKVSPYLPRPGDDPIITSWTLVMSLSTGAPLLLVDSAELTAERTGASTALAVRALAPDARTLAVVGSGPIARAHLRHLLDDREWDAVRVFSPSLAQGASETVHAVTAAAPDHMVAASIDACVDGADVVCLCTSAARPLIDMAALAPRALVTSTASNGDLAHEIDPASVSSFEVWCDDRTVAVSTAGELVLAARDHGWDPARVAGDLWDLCATASPPPATGRRLYRSVGHGLQDLVAAGTLLDDRLAVRD